MLKNALAAGLRPGPRWGSLQRSPDPLAGKGGGAPGKGGRKGRGGEEGRGRGRGRAIPPIGNPGYGPGSEYYSIMMVS